MVLMEKDNLKKYVPDVFINDFRAQGYKIVGESDDVKAPAEEVKTTKPKAPKKK